VRALGPRDLRGARRSAALLATVGVLVTSLFAVLAPAAGVAGAVDVVVPLVLGDAALGLVVSDGRRAEVLCVLTPLLGVAAIAVLDVATRDATAAGQVFFCLPVLYAGSQLRPPGVVLVAACAVAGDALVALALLPADRAVTDLAYVGVTVVLIGVLLARAGAQHDRLVAQLSRRAAVDPLTGLVTRRVLDEALSSALSSARTDAGTALVLLDVDRFKTVNDTHGHPVGDDALHHIGVLLTARSRAQDVVARMGGDELAVLLPGCAFDTAVRRAEDLVRAVGETPLVLGDGTVVRLSVSAGVSHVPDHAAEGRELFASADAALYRAKRAGRGRVGTAPASPGLVRAGQPPAGP
jgi:diguanylate cyclase (GGDEF)-like protein